MQEVGFKLKPSLNEVKSPLRNVTYGDGFWLNAPPKNEAGIFFFWDIYTYIADGTFLFAP